MSNVFSENDLEILIATKDRKNLDFLSQMFPFKPFSNYTILIINQSEINILKSDFSSVRVINTNEKGLSKSRNMAIRNATKKICLIADDDVVYFPNFENAIINAFNQNLKTSVITFNHQRIGKNKPQNSSQKGYKHDLISIWRVSSIEIAFQLNVIKENNLFFDEYFGLGSFFETAEEFLFLKNAIELNINPYFSPLVIVSHPLLSSGNNQGNDKLIFARAALFYKTKSVFVYLWLLKYVFFLVQNNYIKRNECVKKYKIGLSGIRKYKELVKLK